MDNSNCCYLRGLWYTPKVLCISFLPQCDIPRDILEILESNFERLSPVRALLQWSKFSLSKTHFGYRLQNVFLLFRLQYAEVLVLKSRESAICAWLALWSENLLIRKFRAQRFGYERLWFDLKYMLTLVMPEKVAGVLQTTVLNAFFKWNKYWLWRISLKCLPNGLISNKLFIIMPLIWCQLRHGSATI